VQNWNYTNQGQNWPDLFPMAVRGVALFTWCSAVESCAHRFPTCSSRLRHLYLSDPKPVTSLRHFANNDDSLCSCSLSFLCIFASLPLLNFPSPANPRGLAGKPNCFNYIVLIRGSCLRIEGNCTSVCAVFSSENGRLGKWRALQIYPSKPAATTAWK
jgi:hypothetical protein